MKKTLNTSCEELKKVKPQNIRDTLHDLIELPMSCNKHVTGAWAMKVDGRLSLVQYIMGLHTPTGNMTAHDFDVGNTVASWTHAAIWQLMIDHDDFLVSSLNRICDMDRAHHAFTCTHGSGHGALLRALMHMQSSFVEQYSIFKLPRANISVPIMFSALRACDMAPSKELGYVCAGGAFDSLPSIMRWSYLPKHGLLNFCLEVQKYLAFCFKMAQEVNQRVQPVKSPIHSTHSLACTQANAYIFALAANTAEFFWYRNEWSTFNPANWCVGDCQSKACDHSKIVSCISGILYAVAIPFFEAEVSDSVSKKMCANICSPLLKIDPVLFQTCKSFALCSPATKGFVFVHHESIECAFVSKPLYVFRERQRNST